MSANRNKNSFHFEDVFVARLLEEIIISGMMFPQSHSVELVLNHSSVLSGHGILNHIICLIQKFCVWIFWVLFFVSKHKVRVKSAKIEGR